MATAKLQPAFSWQCPNCGAANFEHAFHHLPKEARVRDALLRGWEYLWDEMPEHAFKLYLVLAPGSVFCPSCQNRFETAEPAAIHPDNDP